MSADNRAILDGDAVLDEPDHPRFIEIIELAGQVGFHIPEFLAFHANILSRALVDLTGVLLEATEFLILAQLGSPYIIVSITGISEQHCLVTTRNVECHVVSCTSHLASQCDSLAIPHR